VKAQVVDVKKANGRVLSATIFRPGGKKLLAKGHTVSEEDARMLEAEGLAEVWVTQLDADEVGEDEAVMQVALASGCGSLEIKPAAGGRANLVTTEPCCVLVDEGLLKQINCTSSTVIATTTSFSHAARGQRVATVKSIPFAVAREQLEAVIAIIQERGPILQARPIRSPAVAVLYTDPVDGARGRELFEGIVRQKLERLEVAATFVLTAIEEEVAVTRALQHLLRGHPTAILVASTTAPAGPEDVIGRAMLRAGCRLERFLAPVEPGTLFLLGYVEDVPVVSVPGCFRSAKRNVIDLVLPPMLARYRMTSWEIACLGHGGLLA